MDQKKTSLCDVSSTMRKFQSMYEGLKSEAFSFYKKGKLEESLTTIVAASTFAWWYHIGYWSDEELEELLGDLSIDLVDGLLNKTDDFKTLQHNVFFITTLLTNYGGHTESLKLWIDCMVGVFENIYLVSTEVLNKTSGEFREFGINNKVEYIKLSHRRYTDKIQALASLLIQKRPSYVILFIDPNDVVALAALGHLKTKINFKIIFFNHSDHTFWLGKKIIDVLVEFRSFSFGVSWAFRNFRGGTSLIPLTTTIHKSKNDENYSEILKSLNLSDNIKTISLTIGAPWKFVNDNVWDYFKVIEKILSLTNDHLHILITRKDKFQNYIENRFSLLPKECRKRFVILYDVSNPLPYYKIADFVIESFPIIGGTVRLEAMALGKPVIFIENHICPLLSATDAIPNFYKYVARSGEEVVRYAGLFLNNIEERKHAGRLLKEYFDRNFDPEIVCMKVKSLINSGHNNIKFGQETHVHHFCDYYYLLNCDITFRGLINPYLILGKILLDHRHISAVQYLHIFRKLSLNDILFGFRKLVADTMSKLR